MTEAGLAGWDLHVTNYKHSMKTLLLIISLFPILGFAQANQPTIPVPQRRSLVQGESAQSLPDNYRITLTVTDKDKQSNELSLVVASPEFAAETIEPSMAFSGTITPEEGGSVLIRYSLAATAAIPCQTMTSISPSGKPVTSTSIQYKTSNAHATARLQIGEPLQILKSGGCVYLLSISRLEKGAEKAQ